MTEEKRTFLTPFIKQCYVTCTVCMSTVALACASSYPAVLLPSLQLPDSTIRPTLEEASWIASMISIFVLVGSWFAPWLMTGHGRKMTTYVGIFIGTLGWIMIIFASNVWTINFVKFITLAVRQSTQYTGSITSLYGETDPLAEVAASPWITTSLIIARSLHGIATGVILPARTAMVGECSSPKYRGAFLGMIAVSSSLGNTLVHFIGSMVNWQKTAIISWSFFVIALIMTVLCPESPSYFAQKGKYDKCKKVFRWLRGDNEENELSKLINSQINQNESMIANSRKRGLRRILQILKKKEFFKPLLLMIAMNVTSVAGQLAMTNYSTVILGNILGKNANVSFWMVAIDVETMLLGVIALFVVDKFKRRTLMLSTGVLCLFCIVALSAYVYAVRLGMLKEMPWLAITLLILQFAAISMGLIPLPIILLGEIFPLEHRGLAGSINILSLSIISTIILKSFQGLVVATGIDGTYAINASLLAVSLTVIWFLMPETKGKTLQEIEESFNNSIHKNRENKLLTKKDSKNDLD